MCVVLFCFVFPGLDSFGLNKISPSQGLLGLSGIPQISYHVASFSFLNGVRSINIVLFCFLFLLLLLLCVYMNVKRSLLFLLLINQSCL